jgi:cyclophilin family peptidyl-prolyl cis-trans isomerase
MAGAIICCMQCTRFAARDSLPLGQAPIVWPEPGWRLRYRALSARRGACDALRSALADSALPVRLHAADLIAAQCAMDDSLASVLRQWVDTLPADASRRSPVEASWHAAAHASDDRPPAVRAELPPEAVALALGADVRLRITMAPSSGGGSFVVRLHGDIAPMMAARTLALTRSGYYDGLSWHRVEHAFVIQGGSPGANEYVGLAEYLRDELGTGPHVRGTLGMSTRGHDTGDAQWFINLKDNLRLNRDYTVFAEVIEGIDVVDGILEGDVMARVTVER